MKVLCAFTSLPFGSCRFFYQKRLPLVRNAHFLKHDPPHYFFAFSQFAFRFFSNFFDDFHLFLLPNFLLSAPCLPTQWFGRNSGENGIIGRKLYGLKSGSADKNLIPLQRRKSIEGAAPCKVESDVESKRNFFRRLGPYT